MINLKSFCDTFSIPKVGEIRVFSAQPRYFSSFACIKITDYEKNGPQGKDKLKRASILKELLAYFPFWYFTCLYGSLTSFWWFYVSLCSRFTFACGKFSSFCVFFILLFLFGPFASPWDHLYLFMAILHLSIELHDFHEILTVTSCGGPCAWSACLPKTCTLIHMLMPIHSADIVLSDRHRIDILKYPAKTTGLNIILYTCLFNPEIFITSACFHLQYQWDSSFLSYF